MSTAAVEVLDLLSRQIIDIDEAIRLLKAVRKSSGRASKIVAPLPDFDESEVLMEMFTASKRSAFGTGNIVLA